MKIRKGLVWIFIGYCTVQVAFGQGKPEDYQRADAIKGAMEQDIWYAPTAFHWTSEGNGFWYQQSTPKGVEFIWVDVANQAKQPAFNQEKLAASLSAKTGIRVESYHLPIQEVELNLAAKQIAFQAFHYSWRFDLNTYACLSQVELPEEQAWESRRERQADETAAVPSPDGKWEAYIREANVFVRSLTDATVFPLSFDGSVGDYYAAELKWSPDSRKLITYKIRPNVPHPVYLIESSPADQLQPKLHTRNYLKPGDALPVYTPALFDLESKKQIPVTGLAIDQQFSLSELSWRKDSRAFTFEYNQRGHQLYQVIRVDANSGTMTPLISEESKTFIDYRGKKYRYDLDDGREIIWASERDGWNHLYLIDGQSGKVINQITKGPWVVRKVLYVDEADQAIIFAASGRDSGIDPYLVKYYRVHFDGSGLSCLTPEDANHLAFFSNDFRYFADAYSRIDLPPTAVLRRSTDGKVVMKLEQANIDRLLASGWSMPEPFHAKGRDGQTDIWGIIVRPSHFDAHKKYPIIEYIYAGPQNAFVPKSFISEPAGGDYRPWTALHELAELGFIVVQLDGMGTSNRSKAFHDVCWKNLKDAGFPDRIRWIQAAAQQYPYLDTSRVGIYGNSAGGQNSVAALLFHPEFYKVAVSSSGCHDNRMDKMGWNELWMGYPVGPQYAESSNVTNAYRLQGKLLLILGEMDTNVPPESTLQLVNALIQANKNFDFLMVPGMGHSLGGDYGEHKRRDFFVKHLLGMEPPTWSGMQQQIAP